MGRFKGVININGVKLVAADIQTAIEQALGSRVARIVSFPSRTADNEQVTVAYVPHEWPMMAEDVTVVEDLMVQACFLATTLRPFIFSLKEQSLSLLLVSALGKISRAKMKSLFEAGVFDEDVNSHHQTLNVVARSKREKGGQQHEQAMSETEALLINYFVETVGISSCKIDIDTPVFHMGFTSMDLIRLKHQIEARLATSVPLIILIKHPTARLLAAALTSEHELSKQSTEANPNARYDPIVTFRSQGTKTPLWIVHPGIGEVLVFFGLAHHLSDNDRPIYALRARGFETGETRFDSINETVETYVAAIRKGQPRGPYALAGYSYGTMIAFEMAKKLDPDRVSFLASFNLPPYIKTRMRELNWNMCLSHLSHFLGLITEEVAESLEERGFRNLSRGVALSKVLAVVESGRMKELGLAEDGFSRWTDVAYGLQSMAVDYDPEGIVDNIDIFHAVPLKVAAASRHEWIHEHLSKWSDFCRTEPRYHVVGFALKLKIALAARGI